jgi:hypothetical protein
VPHLPIDAEMLAISDGSCTNSDQGNHILAWFGLAADIYKRMTDIIIWTKVASTKICQWKMAAEMWKDLVYDIEKLHRPIQVA